MLTADEVLVPNGKVAESVIVFSVLISNLNPRNDKWAVHGGKNFNFSAYHATSLSSMHWIISPCNPIM